MRVDSPATQRAAQIRVRFIGAEGNFNSVATHGHRINTGINGLGDPHVTSEIVELPRDAFDTRLPHWLRRNTAWLPLVEDIDVLVVVKSSVFDRFESGAAGLRALCKERGIILVSSPADGPGANAGDTRDRFSEEIADYVLTASREQYEYLCEHRDSATVFHLGVATRPPRDESLPVRERVRTVVGENPTHYDPNFNATRVGMSKAEYAGFETQIRAFCEERGAELLAFGYWRDNQ
ncbi:MAG TPA: hypothetical protein VG845_08500, partial [Dehalococcoidia bacterium]|nr:hypothetical protein [Dehalococcoidia bacterium]